MACRARGRSDLLLSSRAPNFVTPATQQFQDAFTIERESAHTRAVCALGAYLAYFTSAWGHQVPRQPYVARPNSGSHRLAHNGVDPEVVARRTYPIVLLYSLENRTLKVLALDFFPPKSILAQNRTTPCDKPRL
jgi:hypothetical protein